MPTPRKKKVRKNLIGARVLASASLTTATAADEANLLDIALKSSVGGGTTTFENGSTTLLTDAISDADGNWSAGGTLYTLGETSDLDSSDVIPHYRIPKLGTVADLNVTETFSPFLVYSEEGPQAKLNHKYFETTPSSGSITFDTEVTGSGPLTYTKLYFAGTMFSGSVEETFDKLELYTGSNPPVLTASVTGTNSFLSGSIYIPNTALDVGLKLSFSSSADLTSQWTSGFFVFITGSTAASGDHEVTPAWEPA